MKDTILESLLQKEYKILKLFLNEPDKKRTLSDIAQELSMNKMTIYRLLERLIKQGMMRSRSDGYRRYFMLKKSPILRAMKVLISAESHICMDILNILGGSSRLIMLYGSRANGTDGPDSDWDFIVVSDDLDDVALNKTIVGLERKYDSNINVKLLTVAEYRNMKAKITPFYQEVIGSKFILRGDADEA